MKILLVRPPEFRESAFAQMYPVYESLGLGYVAAGLRKNGYEVEILDARLLGLSIEQTVENVLARNTDLIGFSMPSGVLFNQVSEIIRRVKNVSKDVHITLGGQYPTFGYKYILKNLPEVDSIVRFEGDYTILDLVKAIHNKETWINIPGLAFINNNEIITTPHRQLVADLDELPFPSRDTLPEIVKQSGAAIISTSRGCYANCSFCSVRSFYCPSDGKLWRGRSVSNTIKEIKWLKTNFNPDQLWFADDNVFGPGVKGAERLKEIFQILKSEDITFDSIAFSCRVNDVLKNSDIFELARKTGLKTVYLGVESGVQRILDIYNKKVTVGQNLDAIKILKDMGIEIKMEFIFFNPWITLTEIEENLAFLNKTGLYDPYILSSALTIHTYAPIWKKIETGELTIVRGNYDLEEHVDTDSYRPYSFHDKYVQALFDIISNTFPLFEPIFYNIWCLEDLIRREKKEAYQDHERYMELHKTFIYIKKIVNEVGMDLFVHALESIKNTRSINNKDLNYIAEDIARKICNLSFVVTNIVDKITRKRNIVET